jgi:hypothetical protein
MSMHRKGLTFGALMTLAALCGPATAQSESRIAALIPILAPEPGNKACYSRAYDAAHMKAHPQQRITAMKFLLSVAAYDPKPADATKPEDLYYYTFAMSVTRRGDKRLLHAAGDCNSGDNILCAVDCDGGSVTLDKMPPANSLIVRLNNENGITMFHDCDEGKGAVVVKAGADDKVFRLDKATAAMCKSLEDKEK